MPKARRLKASLLRGPVGRCEGRAAAILVHLTAGHEAVVAAVPGSKLKVKGIHQKSMKIN